MSCHVAVFTIFQTDASAIQVGNAIGISTVSVGLQSGAVRKIEHAQRLPHHLINDVAVAAVEAGSIKAGSYTTVTATDTEPVEYTFTYSRPSSGSSSYDPTYSVSTPSKTEHGTVTVSPKSASKGDRVTVTVKPDSGYVLETLTVTDKNGNELTLKDKGNGK